MRWGPVVALLVGAALAGCGPAVFDPVFESVHVEEAAVGSCDPTLRCVSVTAPVVGSRRGAGSCEVYGPGDPDTQTPLARSEKLVMMPDEKILWVVAVPPELRLRDLNPVCRPMVEG